MSTIRPRHGLNLPTSISSSPTVEESVPIAAPAPAEDVDALEGTSAFIEFKTPADLADMMLEGLKTSGMPSNSFSRMIYLELGKRLIPPEGLSFATNLEAMEWLIGNASRFQSLGEEIWEGLSPGEQQFYAPEAHAFDSQSSLYDVVSELVVRTNQKPDSPERTVLQKGLVSLMPLPENSKIQ